MPAATPLNSSAVRAALSEPRFGTYLTATGNDEAKAVALYGWNARIAAALMLPAHFAEVCTRNAASEAIARVYGPDWPWNRGFLTSLPDPRGTYSPRRDLINTASKLPSTGKVVAELKFVFWPRMFTARHDARLWTPHIRSVFPHASVSESNLRSTIYTDLDAIRRLRNRLAHHEPLLRADLAKALAAMSQLVHLRSEATGMWVDAMEEASALIPLRPR